MDNHIYDRGHLSDDLKGQKSDMRGIIIFPMMQQLSFLEFPFLCFKVTVPPYRAMNV